MSFKDLLSGLVALQYDSENSGSQKLLDKQVIMEFPEAFWEGSVDYFGAAVPGGPAARGRCFMFWNLQRFAQKPILTAVVAGEAAEVCTLETAQSCMQHRVLAGLWHM